MSPLPRWAESELTAQFTVDEPRESLYAADVSEDAPRGEGPAVAGADLLTLVARVLVENERLAALATQLKTTAGAETDQEALRVVKSLLPVLDSFDRILEMGRGFEGGPELANWLLSVETVQARLLQTLERLGLEPVDPLGQPVDLDRDEVVAVRPAPGQPPDTIVEVRRKGYRFRGKMIRDAQVIVAQHERRG